ncbi:hypothetical protein, partial [Heyndrickxia faecalis]|uniref:hypothetical protein n=2 Tax=Heyndrickxia faecalis TaxID=2824910 RepID=UPI003D21DE4F
MYFDSVNKRKILVSLSRIKHAMNRPPIDVVLAIDVFSIGDPKSPQYALVPLYGTILKNFDKKYVINNLNYSTFAPR